MVTSQWQMRLVLVTVAVVNVIDCSQFSETDSRIYYRTGHGPGQPQFNWAPKQPYVHFNSFCDEEMVREVTIQGRLLDRSRSNAQFLLHLKLEHNETVARETQWNWMSYALFVNNDQRGEDQKNRGYLYQLPSEISRPAAVKQTTVQQERNYKGYTQNLFKFQAGHNFTLRILVQPSHLLLVLTYDDQLEPDVGNMMINHYGYFYELDDSMEHWNEFTDSIFDTIHLEGDVEIAWLKIRSGGPLTRPEALPNRVRTTKPYTNGKFIVLEPISDGSFDGVKFLLFKDGDYRHHMMKQEEEWELNLRGRIGAVNQTNLFKFLLQDYYYRADFVSVTSIMSHPATIKLESMNQNTDYSYYSPTDEYWDRFVDFQSYLTKYRNNPFQRNTNFEMSIRRLSNSNQNLNWPSMTGYNDYNGYPRSTMQITIRVQCRIWTWYFHAHNYYILHALNIIGDVNIYEAVLVSWTSCHPQSI